jgi:hypothetical protein
MQIWNLQKILFKKRDPITHLNFLILLENNPSFHAGRFGGAGAGAGAAGAGAGAGSSGNGKGGNEAEMEEEEEDSHVGVVYGKYFALVTYEMSKIFLSLGRTFKFVKEVFIREYPLFREKMVQHITMMFVMFLWKGPSGPFLTS